MRKKWPLFLIFWLALGVRIYGLEWDQGFHLHPDERMIVMVVEKLRWPSSWRDFFSPQSSWNPHFFPYGSFPLYLLKLVAEVIASFAGAKWTTYQYLPIIGRLLSVSFDLGTMIILFKIAREIFRQKTAVLAVLFYATCVLPLQLAHFYAVDPMLNFFIWLTIWRLLCFYRSPSGKNALVAGVAFGFSLATKVSATLLIVSLGTALGVDLLLLFKKKSRRRKLFFETARRFFLFGGIVLTAATFTFIICEPYALIDFATFWRQISQQHQMTKDAYVFPYTLQYVGTLPYFYFLKNMVLWGMGIGLGTVSLIGVFWYLGDLVRRLKTKGNYDQEAEELIIIVFVLAYFLVVGRFAVKFMRYFLPLYPFFVLIGAHFLLRQKRWLRKSLFFLLGFAHSFWLISFLSIYSRPHSRVQASQWINSQIPPGSILAVEHWDDRLPLWGGGKYQFVQMPLYEDDFSAEKWSKIKINLQKADYLIIASRRLYVPLQKLADCTRYKKCYPKTAQYYQDLFAGKLGFEKVAEFVSYPGIFKDDNADESFAVYDHPQVLIFAKKNVQ